MSTRASDSIGEPFAARVAHLEPEVLRLKRLGIDTYQEPVIFVARSSPVCRSEGWAAQSRVQVACGTRAIIATLNVTTDGLLAPDEASLSEVAWEGLGAVDGSLVRLSAAPLVDSLSFVRAKVYGDTLADDALEAIVSDIVAGRYSDIDLAAFVTAFAGPRVSVVEATALTRAMIRTGERLYWGRSPIVDKHCVGGLPGNRTSMIVVPLVAACGLVMPKTSSRAITSPAGTADAMETVAPVDLDLAQMRAVVEREGACIVWGGRVRLAPADDVIISVERPLDFDSPLQLVASILSKKAAAGSTHVVIDIPIGLTAKVRSPEAADALGTLLGNVARAIGLTLDVVRTDGTQPVGRGIGPPWRRSTCCACSADRTMPRPTCASAPSSLPVAPWSWAARCPWARVSRAPPRHSTAAQRPGSSKRSAPRRAACAIPFLHRSST